MIVAEVNSKVLVETTHCGDLWLTNSATLSEPVFSRRIDMRLALLGPILYSRIDTSMTEKRNRDDGRSMDELHAYCDRSDPYLKGGGVKSKNSSTQKSVCTLSIGRLRLLVVALNKCIT